MKRKLNLILIPITLAVAGILYFQVDWMIKTYKAELNKLSNGSGTAMLFALERFRNEQRSADSTYIYHNLKKWVDTVKMCYINGGDSLHIDLEYVHTQIPNPSMKTGYYMHVSLSSPDKISIMSPGILSAGKITPAIIAANLRNGRLDDSLSKFFHRNKITDGRVIYMQTGKRENGQAFKLDSAKILKYFKTFLQKNNVTDPDKNPPVILFNHTARYMPKYALTYLPFQHNIFHKYPGKNLIAYYFPNKPEWIITQIALRVFIAVLLVLILIFSFTYLINIIKQQKQLADIKDDFIDNLTHEFKTPIATISAAIEGMQ
ncbi:MAG: hypothetical protein H7289_06600, partial [Mucilaginibacter sp.]|nr:hypothetical protein [Mucilaginibacter sp.]